VTDITTNYGFYLPTLDGARGEWGEQLNANFTALDIILATIAGLGVGVEEAPTDGQNYVRSGLGSVWNPALSSAELALALANYVALTGDQTVAGIKTFSSSVKIPNDAYGAGWAGKLEAAPKGAIYAQLQSMAAASKPTKQFIWAKEMFLPSSGGCSPLAAKVDDVTHLGYEYLGFSAANQYAHFNALIPEGWNGGTVQAEVYFSGSNADINTVRWMIHVLHVAQPQLLGLTGTNLFPVLTSGSYSQVETNPGLAFQIMATPIADLAVSGTGSPGCILQGAIRRGTDLYTGVGQLVGVMLTWVNS
jgi:hypothetical protein